VKDEDTSTSGPLFETSNTPPGPTQPEKGESCGRDSATSSRKPKRLPRRWMPTMTPRTKNGPTMGMTLRWECRNGHEAAAMELELEELLRASERYALNLPGWQVYWQLSRDPKAAYRLGLILWMEPESPLPF